MLAAYRDAGGRGKAVLQVHLSWAPTEQEAVAVALDQWRSNVFAPPIPWDLPTAAHFDGVSADVGEEQVRNVGEHLRGHRAARAVARRLRRPGLRRAVPALRRAGAGAVHRRLRANTCSRSSAASGQPAARTGRCCCENRRDLGPLVEERRHLLPGPGDVLRRRRRRHRGFRRPDPARGLPRRAGRDVHLADAVLPLPGPGRRLRRHGHVRRGSAGWAPWATWWSSSGPPRTGACG